MVKGERRTRWWITCGAALVLTALPKPAHGLSSLIIIPTARTIGDHRYSQALTSENVVFGVGEQKWVLKTRLGLGPRAEVGLNIDPGASSGATTLWQAKDVLTSINHGQTVASVGFRSFGANSKWSPYAVITHGLGLVDTHAGLVRSRSAVRYFLGADGRITSRWRWMADFTSGSKEFWSVGADCRIDSHWSLRIGQLFHNNGEASPASVEVRFGNTY